MDSSKDGKIGIGVVTYNRPVLFRECIAGIPDVGTVVVVNDGNPYESQFYPSWIENVIQHRTNRGVGRSKNDALRVLLQAGCSHIFLCEDDIRIVNPKICSEYIRASERSGILHFNFAYHGSENKAVDGLLLPPRKTAEYDADVSLSFHRHLLGAFQYFRADVLRECGLFDPFYVNMLEHIDHTYRIIKHGFHPPFWWFADLTESSRYIEDLDPRHEKSTGRSNQLLHQMREKMSALYFTMKHGTRLFQIPDTNEADVDCILTELKQRHPNKMDQE